MISLLLTLLGTASAQDFLHIPRPARVEATVEVTMSSPGATRSQSVLVTRRAGDVVQVFVSVTGGAHEGERVLLEFDATGPTGAWRSIKTASSTVVDRVVPTWVIARFEELGIYPSDLVEVLAPTLRGSDWQASEGGYLSPADQRGCRNIYKIEGVLPSAAAYCRQGTRQRSVTFESPYREIQGYSLPSAIQVREGKKEGRVLFSYSSASAEPGPSLLDEFGTTP